MSLEFSFTEHAGYRLFKKSAPGKIFNMQIHSGQDNPAQQVVCFFG